MEKSFKLPDLGEGIHEGEVTAIHVSEGDHVEEEDAILEIETDKAAVDIPSPYTGTVSEIKVSEGDVVNVGDVIMVFDVEEEEAEKDEEESETEEAEAEEETGESEEAEAEEEEAEAEETEEEEPEEAETEEETGESEEAETDEEEAEQEEAGEEETAEAESEALSGGEESGKPDKGKKGKVEKKKTKKKPEAKEKAPPGAEEKKEPAEKEQKKEKKAGQKEGPVPASPATRRLAREMGVNLRDVTPSGKGGVVTREDVESFAEEGKKAAEQKPERKETPEKKPAREQKKPEKPKEAEGRPITVEVPPLPDFEKWGPVQREPVRSIRRAIARQMALSWSQIPHVTSQDTADVTGLEAFRQKHKEKVAEKGGRLTLTIFAMKAVVGALKAFPRFNASLDPEAGEIVLKQYYHIGVAVDTPDGLIVPVIRDVDRKSITDLSIELAELIEKTRDRKTGIEDLQGGSFTITNIGPLGGGHFAPIINYPQVAIMGMGSAKQQPVVRETRAGRPEIVPRLMLPMVLTIDHRVLDGADSSRFLRMVIDALEDPEELLMTMA